MFWRWFDHNEDTEVNISKAETVLVELYTELCTYLTPIAVVSSPSLLDEANIRLRIDTLNKQKLQELLQK